MAVQVGDGSLEKAADVSSYLNTARVLVSSSGFGESSRPNIAAKAGISFVIPKNKLSSALVPVVRNVADKWNPNDGKEEDFKSLVPQRKTNWGCDLTQDPAVKRGRALALQTRAEQIAAQLESGQLETDTNEATRSPSPPPIYDSNGQRTNTREGRRREQLELERREAIGDCLQLNPFYKPPSGYKPVYKEAKLYIPVKDYPGYNFIGLILGPRGNTQKRMEAETGSRIAIRGKGAVKEGKKSNASHLQGGRRDGKEAGGAFEDLHVHITADSVEKVDAAVALVEPLLTPVDEDRNTHKRKQLRELAEMNGTMRDFSKACGGCGENGHREWHCPKDKLVSFQAKVDCQICRDGGHPTVDCPRKQAEQGKVLDKEYLNFLEELGNGLAVPTPGLFTKAGGEVSTRTNSQPNPITTATRLDDAAITSHVHTSFDPNQLVDVVSRTYPSIIAINQPQHIPSAWTPVNTFTSLQQGGHGQSEVDRQFSAMFQRHRAQFGFKVTSGNFTHLGFSHAPVSSAYQGLPSSAVHLNMGGLPAPPNFHPGLDRVQTNRSRFYGDTEAGPGYLTYPMPPDSGHLRGPGQMQVPPENPTTAQTSPWNQTANSQPVGAENVSLVVGEENQHPRPLAAWKRGLPPQPPLSPWLMTCEQGWKEEPPAIPLSYLGQSASPSWEVTQKPREAHCPWNASCFPIEVNQPWHSTQERPLHCTQPSAPNPAFFVWRGGPAPRIPLPVQCESILPPPPNPPCWPHLPHLDPFAPWHSQSQLIPESNKPLNNPVVLQASQCSGSAFISQPLPLATWGLQRVDDLCALNPHPPPPKSSNIERDGSPTQVKDVFALSSVVGRDSPSNLNTESQIQPAVQTSFAALPKTGWNQQGLCSVQPLWQSSKSHGPDTKPTPTIPAPGSPVEVDAEYETLMASVGVT